MRKALKLGWALATGVGLTLGLASAGMAAEQKVLKDGRKIEIAGGRVFVVNELAPPCIKNPRTVVPPCNKNPRTIAPPCVKNPRTPLADGTYTLQDGKTTIQVKNGRLLAPICTKPAPKK